MTEPAPVPLEAALAPVREALLSRARADADAVLAAADADVAAALAEARTRAEKLVADARAEGERDAEVLRSRAHARTQREARGTVLRAQADAYRELRDRSRAAASALRADPGYPALLDALRARVRARLGPDATVREHPDGGLVAEVPGRRLDASLPALADDAVDALAGDAGQLWAP